MRVLGECTGLWLLAAVGVGCGDMNATGRVHADASARADDAGRDAGALSARVLPAVPVGFDAYRDLSRMPILRIGARAYMRSTYDRSGGNEGADASHFLRSEADDFNVTLDLTGPGVVYFARTNHWHGSPWHYVVDGSDFVVSESSTADPTKPVADSVFLPEDAFPSPLAVTWSLTKGADLSWVPIPFRERFTLAYGRTHYGTGYYIYQQFPEGSGNLSRSVESYAPTPPDADTLALFARAGDDLAPGNAELESGDVTPTANGETELSDLHGARTIVALKLRFAASEAAQAARSRLRIRWDDRAAASVDAPLPLFFGSGTFYNRDGREWLVRALLASVHFTNDAIELSSYFPMPFFSRAQLELVSEAEPLSSVHFELKTLDTAGDSSPRGYFHASYRDHGTTPTLGQDLVVLDTREIEDGGDSCGSFVGMSWIFSHAAELSTLEGDPRFFFDDSDSPQAYGTGTEEWGGGGDYWGGETMSLALAGHPTGAPSLSAAQNAGDEIESAYRFLIADAFPFGKNARIQLEHGGLDDSSAHYESVAYWYGAPGACLVQTDALDVGDVADERAHGYRSPDASAIESVSSRFELGPDTLNGVELFPETTLDGRHTTGTSEFRIALRADNYGVLLRRTLDYAFPDQRADVFVADDRAGAGFVRAGTWFLAGSNRCVYSNPPGELDPPAFTIESSNRRLRQDEFLIRRELTEGKRAIRVRIVASPEAHPLLPGEPLPSLAWSELDYRAYSWVLPPLPR